ncbi:hypothetical protein ABL78_4188 [Leptomonas seymouri]|uniref:RING-type domain-containing protein n=1 Tax=Leptomonas seymouri TaxID=5684 RepID=A0A0N1HYK3_LEPSE|nr:hypothetical protein ABL78_4188 [Leptomonas seymouri]|eukprot:KPI86718.1 hypothetical protein ABL78_4188 [Leptomonas seymouri]
MGASLCCCGDSGSHGYRTPPSRPSRPNEFNSRPFDPNRSRQDRQQVEGNIACELCGAQLAPALFDGHREACRTNHLRAILAKNAALLSEKNLRPTMSNPQLHDDLHSAGEKELCVVCMDHPRCYAFLPCGHICCCHECTKSLDRCPLCREPREGLCYVSANVASQYECKHCNALIAPTLFDGHREVCGLRQLEKQREAREAAAAKAKTDLHEKEDGMAGESLVSVHVEGAANEEDIKGDPLKASNSPIGGFPLSKPEEDGAPCVSNRSHAHVCLECGGRYNQLLVCVPCGHRVLCYSCAKQRTTCPVCVSEIRDTVVTFD